MNEKKSVQIDKELFFDLIRYFCIDDNSRFEAIKKRLEDKLDKLVKHELYTTYKTEIDSEKAEQARKEYLNRIGIHENFRW